jgi:hypothetical protein
MVCCILFTVILLTFGNNAMAEVWDFMEYGLEVKGRVAHTVCIINADH